PGHARAPLAPAPHLSRTRTRAPERGTAADVDLDDRARQPRDRSRRRHDIGGQATEMATVVTNPTVQSVAGLGTRVRVLHRDAPGRRHRDTHRHRLHGQITGADLAAAVAAPAPELAVGTDRAVAPPRALDRDDRGQADIDRDVLLR